MKIFIKSTILAAFFMLILIGDVQFSPVLRVGLFSEAHAILGVRRRMVRRAVVVGSVAASEDSAAVAATAQQQAATAQQQAATAQQQEATAKQQAAA